MKLLELVDFGPWWRGIADHTTVGDTGYIMLYAYTINPNASLHPGVDTLAHMKIWAQDLSETVVRFTESVYNGSPGDPNARYPEEIPVTVTNIGIAEGGREIEFEKLTEPVYYDITGRRLPNSPRQGVYFEVRGKKVKKAIKLR